MTVYGRDRHIGDLAPTRGELLAVQPAWVTAEHYGPVSILAVWEEVYEEPRRYVSPSYELNDAHIFSVR